MKNKEPLEYGLIPLDETFDQLEDWWLKSLGDGIGSVRVNLKWAMDSEERESVELFHKQVLLMIGAEAKISGVEEIDLIWSYPTAFPPHIRHEFERLWSEESALQQMLKEAGVNLKREGALEIKNETESVAVCKYSSEFLKAVPGAKERPQIVIDIGGGTSDVAIWLKGKMMAQTSIRLAGNILADYLRENDKFREGMAEILSIDKKIIDSFTGIRSYVITSLILKKSESKIFMELPSKAITPPFKVARSRIFFSYSAVLYYIGQLLRNLIPKGSSTDCDIFLAGNGARLLKWVSESKATEKAFVRILRSSVKNNFDLKEIRIVFSQNPKQEVAIGLLYRPEETGITSTSENPIIILGEDGYKSLDVPLSWGTDIYSKPDELNPDTMHVPSDFPELRNFVDAYNSEARDLDLIKVTLTPGEIKAGVENYLVKFAARQKQNMASVQPLFIEEAKLLLESIK